MEVHSYLSGLSDLSTYLCSFKFGTPAARVRLEALSSGYTCFHQARFREAKYYRRIIIVPLQAPYLTTMLSTTSMYSTHEGNGGTNCVSSPDFLYRFLICLPLSHQDDPIVIGKPSDLPRENFPKCSA